MTYVADLPDEGTVTEYCIILAHFFRAESRRGRHVWSLFSAGVAGERVPAIQHNWPVGSHLLLFSIRALNHALQYRSYLTLACGTHVHVALEAQESRTAHRLPKSRERYGSQ